MLGTLSLLPTIVTGYLAANSVDLTPQSEPLVATHENQGLFVLGVFVACQFWKGWYRGEIPAGQRRLYALVLLAGVLLAVYVALLGGELVYLNGVGVKVVESVPVQSLWKIAFNA